MDLRDIWKKFCEENSWNEKNKMDDAVKKKWIKFKKENLKKEGGENLMAKKSAEKEKKQDKKAKPEKEEKTLLKNQMYLKDLCEEMNLGCSDRDFRIAALDLQKEEKIEMSKDGIRWYVEDIKAAKKEFTAYFKESESKKEERKTAKKKDKVAAKKEKSKKIEEIEEI